MADALARIKALMGEDAFNKAEVEAKDRELKDPSSLGYSTKVDTPYRDPAEWDIPWGGDTGATSPGNSPKKITTKTPEQDNPQQSWKEKKVAKLAEFSDRNSREQERICSALRRLQRYFGLRPKVTSQLSSTDEPTLDYNSATRHPFDLDAIILSVDVEANETNHTQITEIGISTLDTRSLHNLAPSTNGKSWLPHIKARHIRIAEYLHHRNHIFVTGDPEGFLSEFGKSEIIPYSLAAAEIKKCFIPDRNIILIGHSIKGDIKWLRQMGVNILSIPNLVEVVTTDEIQRALKHENKGSTSLAVLLQECEIDAWNLHNAGNDAAYTLQALIVMTLQSLSITRPVVSLEDRIHEAVVRARAQAESEWGSWQAAEMRSGDGKEPVGYGKSHLRG